MSIISSQCVNREAGCTLFAFSNCFKIALRGMYLSMCTKCGSTSLLFLIMSSLSEHIHLYLKSCDKKIECFMCIGRQLV